ncbi:opine metallophore biosynthesis dehydrogenase, partial [Staphylococcus epidermidis]|uniref:opine metallophore biosynthesis dehydrogenase n=1 Tax=Staphylococcus epidermidis TaxID=1282 RepID=UPI00119DB191
TQYYHLLILASTPHPYPPILHQLSNSTLKPIKQIIFLSPTLPSHILLNQILSHVHSERQLISFSTYLPHTPIFHKPQPHSLLTTPLKSKLFLGSTHSHSITFY